MYLERNFNSDKLMHKKGLRSLIYTYPIRRALLRMSESLCNCRVIQHIPSCHESVSNWKDIGSQEIQMMINGVVICLYVCMFRYLNLVV